MHQILTLFTFHSVCILFPQQLESLEAQLADALSDRTKAAETISSLQVKLAII